MSSIEIGSLYIKTSGREKGKRCVIVDLMDKNFVLVTGPPKITGVKRRRCNIEHLEATQYTVKISAAASENDVIKGYEKVGLL